jgi:hypothetical protein
MSRRLILLIGYLSAAICPKTGARSHSESMRYANVRDGSGEIEGLIRAVDLAATR